MKKFLVFGSGRVVDVDGEEIKITEGFNSGELCVIVGGQIVRAFARGTWETVREETEYDRRTR